MPRAPNYSAAFVYKLTAPGTEDVYIGSATTNLKLRLAQHKNHYDRWCSGVGKFLSSFHVLDCSGYKIEKIEDYPCDSAEALHRREGELIKTTPNCCNYKVAGRTHKEWAALPEVKKKDAARRRQNYTPTERAKKKKYYEQHKEKKLAYARKYYEEHKDYFRDYNQKYADKKRLQNAEKARAENVITQQSVNEFFEGNARAVEGTPQGV